MHLCKPLKSLDWDKWDKSSGLSPTRGRAHTLKGEPANMSHLSQPCGATPVTPAGKAARSRASRHSHGSPLSYGNRGGAEPRRFPLHEKIEIENPFSAMGG